MLKLPEVGINENFFALVSIYYVQRNWLLALILPSLLHVDCHRFSAPTIAELAIEVNRYRMEQWNSDSMLDILAEIEALPDERHVNPSKNAQLKQMRN